MFLRPALYRTHAVVLLVAISFPWIASVIYVLGLSPIPGLDLTHVALAVTGTVMAAALAATLRGIIEVSAEHGARTHLIVTLPDMATRTTTTSSWISIDNARPAR
ncbi:MAG: histidine kinase N-terminal 7TM domain-containing protein [Actinomycetota bacterium]